jgi:hypothetical protein
MGSLDGNVSVDFVIFHALNAMINAVAHAIVIVISAKNLILLSYSNKTQLMGHMFKSFSLFAARQDHFPGLCCARDADDDCWGEAGDGTMREFRCL